jgi:acetyl/propionyl-CoA carboxylase alpha subunit
MQSILELSMTQKKMQMNRQMNRQQKPIEKVFIANRGEIARRIALTCKKLGVKSTCITDRKVPPNYLSGIVSDFIFVEKETTQIYLDQDLMVQFAKSCGADALHPGFGFLSENADFARKVDQAGLTWIGPNPSAIDAMASKAEARKYAEKAGVPCLPGLNGFEFKENDSTCLNQLKSFVETAGLPVLMKASYGGGGKGMRIVNQISELNDQAKRAASEAINAFGNGSLIVEKYLASSRHVEVQVLGDQHGHVAILGDRDCSLQRRHQKILEEAPAPNLASSVRKSMHDAARNLAQVVGYDNAGTVEFLVDETNPRDTKFYFLEMNTRLQVEHTVTEEVFGIDLVEWQIQIAQGKTLPVELHSHENSARGHSVEVRIYAEDPGNQFFPVPGPVRAFVPARGHGVRWEIGMDTVDEISTAFDPMISKLVCTASTREQALELMAQTLEQTLFSGPRNNIPLLIWLARHPDVSLHPVDTHFIGKHVDAALDAEKQQRDHFSISAAQLTALVKRDALNASTNGRNNNLADSVAEITHIAFHKGGLAPSNLNFHQAVHFTARSQATSSQFLHQTSYYGHGLFTMSDGSKRSFNYTKVLAPERAEFWIGIGGHNWVEIDEKDDARFATTSAQALGTALVAPVPGKIIQVACKVGDSVKKGTTLFILESMKMQFEVHAQRDGILDAILVSQGDQVSAQAVLGTWKQ